MLNLTVVDLPGITKVPTGMIFAECTSVAHDGTLFDLNHLHRLEYRGTTYFFFTVFWGILRWELFVMHGIIYFNFCVSKNQINKILWSMAVGDLMVYRIIGDQPEDVEEQVNKFKI